MLNGLSSSSLLAGRLCGSFACESLVILNVYVLAGSVCVYRLTYCRSFLAGGAFARGRIVMFRTFALAGEIV